MKSNKKLLIVTVVMVMSIIPLLNAISDTTITQSSLTKQLNLARRSKDNVAIADAYFNLAQYYQYQQNDTEAAFKNYLNARPFYQYEGRTDRVNEIDRFVADRYISLGFLQEGIDIYQNQLAELSDVGNTKIRAALLYSLSKAYKERGDHEQELVYLNQLNNLPDDQIDTLLQINIITDKLNTYLKLNERDSALILAAELVKVSSASNNKLALSKGLYFIGYINYLKHNKDNALKYLLKALELQPDVPFNNAKKEIYATLSSIFEEYKDIPQALAYYKKYTLLNDSILNQNKLSIANELAQRYGSLERKKELSSVIAEKESVLKTSLRQSRALYFVGFGFLLLLVGIYYLIRFYMHRIQTEKIINEQQHQIDSQKIGDLENKMQINSMQAMIQGEERERERIAKDLHDSLGGLLSAIKLRFDSIMPTSIDDQQRMQYSKATQLLDTAVDEVRSISRNLQPTALKRLGLVPSLNDLINRFTGEDLPEIYLQHYDLPPQIDETISLTLYRVIQELLNNSIKYAKAKEILIQLNGEDDDIILQYEDDGLGFDIANMASKGMGLENIKSRIKYLKGSISIDSKIGEGISVFIKVSGKLED